jgi:formylglycine-generating enzyme required for sulfatase activity
MSGTRKKKAAAVRLAIVAGTTFALAQGAQSDARPIRARLESDFAQLKAKTAGLIASARQRLDAMPEKERLAAPPEVWRVDGAGKQFRDCTRCPVMVVIPAGEFTMGSPPSEMQAEAQHRVTIAKPFAVGKFEITFDEWHDCVKAGGCENYNPDDQGWGRGKRPVIDVTWELAKDYVTWLSRKTGKSYRLLTEAEWEYAARAGSATRFSTGDGISPQVANYDGSGDGSGPSDKNRQKTVPVGRFPPNAFGLHDMHGNVDEWVEDCWHTDYTADAPTDGSAWLTGDCGGRVLRGGSWGDSDSELRSAARTSEFKDESSYQDGFRVARDL